MQESNGYDTAGRYDTTGDGRAADADFSRRAPSLGDRIRDGLEQVKDGIAASLEEFGDSIERQARRSARRGGGAARATQQTQDMVDLIDRASLYLHTHDVDEIRGDVEAQIRRNPLLSVGIAFGVGVVLSQLVGGGEDEDEDRYEERGSLVGRLVRQNAAPLLMSGMAGIFSPGGKGRMH